MSQTSVKKSLPVAVIGSGPAGLMVASVLARSGHQVFLFEKKRGPGKKLLIAGKSGLNITHDTPLEIFPDQYLGPRKLFQSLFKKFPPEKWIKFVENLGIKTFKGSTHRYFIEGLKASTLLRAWLKDLKNQGAEIFYHHECNDFAIDAETSQIQLSFTNGKTVNVAAVCFALGGGSYEKQEKPLRWPSFFESQGIRFQKFEASNVGFGVKWPQALLKEVEGQPLKNIVLNSAKGSKKGDLIITKYGLEGNPIYHIGVTGLVHLDLKPDLTAEQIQKKLESSKENLSLIRRAKKYLNLSEVALALIFHMMPKSAQSDVAAFVKLLKFFPLTLTEKRSLDEAISSSGGIDWQELDAFLMLKKNPGVFVAGEMLNWDAPTGGFLIQACASQGFVAGEGMVKFLAPLPKGVRGNK